MSGAQRVDVALDWVRETIEGLQPVQEEDPPPAEAVGQREEDEDAERSPEHNGGDHPQHARPETELLPDQREGEAQDQVVVALEEGRRGEQCGTPRGIRLGPYPDSAAGS